jgi:hypothetical protein
MMKRRDQQDVVAERTNARPGDDVMVQMRLPRDLHAQLKQAAEEAEHGLATEVRHRLQGTFAGGAMSTADPETLRLLNAVAWISAVVANAYSGGAAASWRVEPDAGAVFRRSVSALMDWAAEGKGVTDPKSPKDGSTVDRLIKTSAMEPGMAIGFAAAAQEGFI